MPILIYWARGDERQLSYDTGILSTANCVSMDKDVAFQKKSLTTYYKNHKDLMFGFNAVKL